MAARDQGYERESGSSDNGTRLANSSEVEREGDEPILGLEGGDTEIVPWFLEAQALRGRQRWIPSSIWRFWRRTVNWVKGPQYPQIQRIKPILPHAQDAPIRLLNAFLPKKKQRITAVLVVYLCWILSFGLVLRQSSSAAIVEGLGALNHISCGSAFWLPGNACGINGVDCRPFYNNTLAFICPANCASRQVLNYRAVGVEEVIYRPLIIGGPPEGKSEPSIYRGDSFICGAAIHAGIIDDTGGGCGVASVVGQGQHFVSTKRNGITSIGFDSYFPLSFTFLPDVVCEAKDLRWPLLGVSLIFTILISLFVTSSSVFFFSVFTGVFFHVGLVSDPPYYSTIAALVSNILGKFLPAAFCAFIIYKYCVKRCIDDLTAQIEKTVLWLGGCWVGALSNYTLDWIPIQRLTAHDLEQQPGAKLALAIIIVLLFLAVIKQAYALRLEGRLPNYLGLYGIFMAAILLSLLIPGLSLRIHHYILALFLLPGTGIQTRLSLLCQGLLVGLFINGIARWGFDSILQTPADIQGDAKFDSQLPALLEPVINLGMESWNISFWWALPPPPYDGVSVLVNDVERFRGFVDEGYGLANPFVWTREPASEEPEYFRFAFMEGASTFDYTKAAIWNADGTWIPMAPGPSRVKARALDGVSLKK